MTHWHTHTWPRWHMTPGTWHIIKPHSCRKGAFALHCWIASCLVRSLAAFALSPGKTTWGSSESKSILLMTGTGTQKSLRWLPEQISWLPTNYSHKLHVALSTVAPFAVAMFSWVESQTRFDKAFFMKYVKPLYVLLPHGIGSLKFKAHDRLMQVNHQLQMSYWMNY